MSRQQIGSWANKNLCEVLPHKTGGSPMVPAALFRTFLTSTLTYMAAPHT